MEDLMAIKLKRMGLKITPQRLGILNLLSGNQTHPSANRIFQEMFKEYPGISFATVYNTLSKLVEAGEIQELGIDPNKKRFDPSTSCHYHFYCKICGKVFDIVYEPPLPLNIKKIDGHQVEAIQLNLKGVCKGCRKKG